VPSATVPASGSASSGAAAALQQQYEQVVSRVQSGGGALHPASLGRSAAVKVGEIVLAMGNPLGLTGTVTDGSVSATGRTVSGGQGSSAVLISAIQTSAPINPGNGGGALVDLAGQPTASLAALQAVLAAHKPGEHVRAQLTRDGTVSTVTVTLGSLTS